MSDRPKFEDWYSGAVAYGDPTPRDAWDACMSACEPIIAGLEAERNNLKLSFQAANELRVVGNSRIAELEKQLAEKEAEIAGAYLAAAGRFRSMTAGPSLSAEQWDIVKMALESAACSIESMTPESARQALEQRVAEAVADESDWWWYPHTTRTDCDCKWCSRKKANRAKAEGRHET